MKAIPLKRLATLIAGQSPPSADVADTPEQGLPFLQGNAEFGARCPEPVKWCDTAPRRAAPGDILLSIRAPVGALNVADRQYGIGRGLCAVQPASVNPRFCWWLLHALRQTLSAMAVGSTYDAVTAEDVGSLMVPWWPPPIQRAIADYLDTETARIDALIDKKRRMIELFRYRRQVVITLAVTGAIGPGAAPRGDKATPAEVPLRRLFSSVTGGAWGTEPDDGEIVLPCVRGTDFDYVHLRTDLSRAPLRGFSRSDVALRSARRGDLLIEKSGGGETQPVGRVALHDLDEVVMPTNFAGRLGPADHVDSLFACYLLASLYSDGRTRGVIKQTTGIQNLDLDALLSFRVRCPSLPDQQAIADYLDAETVRIDALTERIETQMNLLYERRQALITAAVTGELDIPGKAA